MLDIYILFEYNIHMMNIKKRLFYFFLSFISILLGVLIYIFFRNGTYIHQFLGNVTPIDIFKSQYKSTLIVKFLKYYFVDYLWCFSLASFLSSITEKIAFRNTMVISVFSALLGILFEAAQRLSLVNGTADFYDIIMYVFAGLSHAVLNIVLFKKSFSRKEQI